MKKIPIKLPTFFSPKTSPEDCDCLKKSIETTYKTGVLYWLKDVDEMVHIDDIICHVEIEKRTYELHSEAEGILVEQLVSDGEIFEAHSILGYIATNEDG